MNRQELKGMALYLAEVDKWAKECPITWAKAGDAVYETIGTHTDDMQERFCKAARELNMPELAESVEIAMLEGEYGENCEDAEAFWRHVASQVEA